MPEPVLRIETAQPQDIPAIIELCQKSIRQSCNGDYTPLQIEAWCRSVADPAKWKLAINSHYFLLAKDGENIVGLASIKDGEYLVYLYVDPAQQRTGVASLLFKNLLKESQRLGKHYIWANVSKTAQAFFRKKGFHVEHERINYLDDVEIRNHRMGFHASGGMTDMLD